MASFWNRFELDNPPPHIEKKRREAVYEWVPCAGSKRKLDLNDQEKIFDEEMCPPVKLYAVDQTVQDHVLDSDGFMKGFEGTQKKSSTEDTQLIPKAEEAQQPDGESTEMEVVTIEEDPNQSTGLPTYMVNTENVKDGDGFKHDLRINQFDSNARPYSSLILSNEVQNSMVKRPVDISTYLAQEMAKQATMAVVLWKPPPPNPLEMIVKNSHNSLSLSGEIFKKSDAIRKNVRIRRRRDDEMETSEHP